MAIIGELKRRGVFRAGAAYAVGGWFVLQLLDVVGEILELPSWGGKLILVLVVLGFFLTVALAWAFEFTPEGIRSEREVDRSQPTDPKAGRYLDRITIVLLVFVVAWFLFDEFYLEPLQVEREAPSGPTVNTAESRATAIAVLPFNDLSQAGDQGWFADGLAEEILNSLARIPELQVAARTASFGYQDSELPLSEIADELGVSYLLSGSVRSTRERLRVAAQLNRSSDGVQVWSETYDRDPENLIALQEDLARSIAGALQINLDPEAVDAMLSAGTESTEAYQAYLRGIALEGGASTRPRDKVLLEIRELHEAAVAADPAFADAWYRLGNWWLYDMMPTNVYFGLSGLPLEAAMEAFDRVINEAIEHAKDRVDQDGYRAMKANVAGRLREAVQRYDDFVTARPNQYAGWSGLLNAAMRASDAERVSRSLAWLRDTGRSSLNSAIHYVGTAYQYEDPSEVADYGLERMANWPESQILIYQVHRALLWAGRTEEAAALVRRIDDDWANKWLVQLRQACAEGRPSDAAAIMERVQADGGTSTWIALKILGRDGAAEQDIADVMNSPIPYQRLNYLGLRIFDPAPFPAAMEMLERENIVRPPALPIPYRCEGA
jgi:TolB-like protein